MLISFSIEAPRVESSIGDAKSIFPSSDRLGMTLIATEETGIELPDGRDLSLIEISLTVFGSPGDLATSNPQIEPGTVGFLSLICGADDDEPFAHGAIVWDHRPLPYFLFQPGGSATITLEIVNVCSSDSEKPERWQTGKECHLLIGSMAIASSLFNENSR